MGELTSQGSRGPFDFVPFVWSPQTTTKIENTDYHGMLSLRIGAAYGVNEKRVRVLDWNYVFWVPNYTQSLLFPIYHSSGMLTRGGRKVGKIFRKY